MGGYGLPFSTIMSEDPKQLFKPHLKFFYADWCGPSQAFKIVIEALLLPYSEFYLPIEYCNTDECDEALLRRWKVDGIPTTILVSGYGKEQGRLVGYNKEEYVHNFLKRGVLNQIK